MDAPIEDESSRRWAILAAGLAAVTAACAVQYGLPYLIPAFRAEGRGLEEATLLATAPIAGLLVTLIPWGVAADRWGERRILVGGLLIASVALALAAAFDTTLARWLLLAVAGGASASVHATSGRLVLGWFPAERRGIAMGIRQMGQPLGVGVGAIVLPVAAAAGGIGSALVVLAGVAVGIALVALVVVRDPERSRRGPGSAAASPYRDAYLPRIHLASALLVIPQFAVNVFAFDYLVTILGWPAAVAGPLLATASVIGAFGRLVLGWWSDRIGSRLRPMRTVAVSTAVVTALLAVLAPGGTWLVVVPLVMALLTTVAPNGLAFTAVAERAGPAWAGRAFGIQNTGQNGVAALGAPVLAALIGGLGGGSVGYAAAFASTALAPIVAAFLIPVRAERPAA
jgi:MFS family permease